MSVRSCILAALTLGPAYGLQLHAEIEARTAHTRSINVGQIYSTLTRLVEAGLVAPLGRSEQNQLPRYELTGAGAEEARDWISGAAEARPDWHRMVEHVLLVVSLPEADPSPLIASYRAFWNDLRPGTSAGTGDGIARAAGDSERLLASAALDWLDGVRASVRSGDIQPRPLSDERPRRGRRPLAVS